MTDEELTELECVIEDYVQEAIRCGYRLGKFLTGYRCGCLLEAVGFVSGRIWNDALPPDVDIWSLAWGFDGVAVADARHNPDLYAMGLRFRERYVGAP